MSNGAQIIIKQNEYMRKFRNAGAMDAKRAKTLVEMRIKPDRIFRSMEDKAVFLQGRTPDSYYMDASAAEDFIETRRRRAFYLILLALVAAIVVFFLGRR
jgi:hypothetical protein